MTGENNHDWHTVSLADEKSMPVGAVFSAVHEGR
jgi:hypothetical protein